MHVSEHFFHYLLILLPFFIASLILFKSSSTLTKFRFVILVVMFVFLAHHVAPSMMPGMNHDNVSHSQLHPCCMPLISDIKIIGLILCFFIITKLFKATSESIIFSKRLYSYANKSPPYFL